MKFGVKKMNSSSFASSSARHKVDSFDRKTKRAEPLSYDEKALDEKIVEAQLKEEIAGMRKSASKKSARDIPDA